MTIELVGLSFNRDTHLGNERVVIGFNLPAIRLLRVRVDKYQC